MVGPIVLAGIKNRGFTFSKRIYSRYFVSFSAITAAAGKGKIVQFSFTTLINRDKMVNIEGVDGIPPPTLTILTALFGSFLDSPFELFRNVPTRHAVQEL